ncbi:MAG TPA: hypothetical protein PKC89_07830 [Pyrinomonadaceae bacterium]|nr:hypothetical protein [Pyrinomonadaceae bacterium]
MHRCFRLFLFFAIVASAVVGSAQTPTSAPTPERTVYKTYAAAMAAGGKLAADKNLAVNKKKAGAIDAYTQAANLARNDLQKADALIEAAKVQKDNSRFVSTGGGKFKGMTFTVFDHPDAVRSLNTALELAGIDDAKRAEIKVLRAEVYLEASKLTDAHNRFIPDLESKLGKVIKSIVRDEMAALAAAASTPPDEKARALIVKGRTYRNFLGKYSNTLDLRSEYQALNDAVGTAGAKDPTKADALLAMAEIARTANDSNSFVAAYSAVSKLPKASPTQKHTAATELANVLIANDRVEPARKMLTETLAVPGLTVIERGGVHRLLAVSYVREIISKKPAKAAEDALMVSARGELATAAKQTKFKGDDLAEAYRGNAEFLRGFQDARYFILAHGELEAALAVPRISDRQRSKVQYEVAETYRLEKKTAEAVAAYKLVTNANPQYFGYAQQRIAELSGAKPGN